jgi:hypothetical protein
VAKVARFFGFYMKNWSWKAILGGVAVNYFGWNFVNVVAALPFFAWLFFHGVGFEEAGETVDGMSSYLITAAVISVFVDILTGYLTAMWTSKHQLAHVVAVAILSFAVVLVSSGDPEEWASWFPFTLLFVMPSIIWGGFRYLHTHGPESKIAPPLDSPSGTPPIAAP